MAVIMVLGSVWIAPVSAEAAANTPVVTAPISVSGTNQHDEVVMEESSTKTISVDNLSDYGTNAYVNWQVGMMVDNGNGPMNGTDSGEETGSPAGTESTGTEGRSGGVMNGRK